MGRFLLTIAKLHWQASIISRHSGHLLPLRRCFRVALVRKRNIGNSKADWLFAGSDRGGESAAAVYTLIATCKFNDVDPEAWLADVLRRIADHPASRLGELLPWNWRKATVPAVAA